MNIKKKCQQIDSLLGDLSSTGIKPIPDLVFQMRNLLHKIEETAQQSARTDENPDEGWCPICHNPNDHFHSF